MCITANKVQDQSIPLNRYYFFEQAIFVTAGVVFFGIFSLLFCKSRTPENHERVGQLHKVFHPLGIFISVVLLIWSVDPRGLYSIYCVELLVTIRDLFNFLLFYAGAEWFVVIIQLLYNSVSMDSDKKLNWIKWVFLITYGSFALIVTIISFAKEKRWYRGLNMAVGSFVAAVVAALCILYYHRIRKSFHNPARRTSPDSAAKFKAAERKILITALGYLVAAALLANYSTRTLKDTDEKPESVIPDRQDHDTYGLGVAHLLLVSLMVWMSWIPLCSSSVLSNRVNVSAKNGIQRITNHTDPAETV